MDIVEGLLSGVRYCPSANANERPEGESINLLVLHNISLPPGQFGTPHIEAFFTNGLDCSLHPYFSTLKGVEVSAHLLISRTGEALQFVPFHRRAWHAGESSFQGRLNCNDFSIGIELEGTDLEPYTDEQYTSLLEISRVLLAEYPELDKDRIVGHADIAPGRKTDPGPAFDWSAYFSALHTGGRQ